MQIENVPATAVDACEGDESSGWSSELGERRAMAEAGDTVKSKGFRTDAFTFLPLVLYVAGRISSQRPRCRVRLLLGLGAHVMPLSIFFSTSKTRSFRRSCDWRDLLCFLSLLMIYSNRIGSCNQKISLLQVLYISQKSYSCICQNAEVL